MTRRRKTEARKKRKLKELSETQKLNKKEMKQKEGGQGTNNADQPSSNKIRIFPGGSP